MSSTRGLVGNGDEVLKFILDHKPGDVIRVRKVKAAKHSKYVYLRTITKKEYEEAK